MSVNHSYKSTSTYDVKPSNLDQSHSRCPEQQLIQLAQNLIPHLGQPIRSEF
jgi:hypothetical protein